MLQSKQQIGRLDERIIFEEKIIGVNVSNEDEQLGWQEVGRAWAEVEDLTGSEDLQADQIEAVRTARFKIRHQEVNVKWRIVRDGEKYNITSVQKANRNGFLHVLAAIGVKYQETTT